MNIKKAIAVIKKGEVIAHATETCYGFACDIFNKKALSNLYKLKKMPKAKPVSIMVSSLKEAKKYGFFNKKAEALARKFWPGPLTIIVKRKKPLPKFLNPNTKTIGIRVPNHEFCLKLLKKYGSPLTTTSANISGKPEPYSIQEIHKQFKNQKLKPDLIINFGKLKRNPSSTVVDVSKKTPEIKREGILSLRGF